MKIIITFILSFLLFFCGCKCKKENDKNWVIELPETKNPTSMNQWAVVKYSLIRLRVKPITKSKIINYMRQASILKVIKKEKELKIFDNVKDYWYYIDYNGEKGWVFGSFIEIFNNYEEAKRKGEKILFGEE